MNRWVPWVAVVLAQAASAEVRPISVAIFAPVPEQAGEGQPLVEKAALLLQEKATALVATSNRHATFHLRQINGMAARHAMAADFAASPVEARRAAERLGARRFFFGRLKVGEGRALLLDGWVGEVGDTKTTPIKVSLPAALPAAIEQGGLLVAQAVTAPEKGRIGDPKSAPPAAAMDKALEHYASCRAILLQQPMGVDAPSVVKAAELSRAVDECRAAVKDDPAFGSAWAHLGLGLAVTGDEAQLDEAISALGKVKGGAFVPEYHLARFWLLTRYQGPAAGEGALKAALKKQPGFLLARGYLAELYQVVGRHADAAPLWQEYAAIAPDSPFLLSKLAYTLARLGKPADALVHAERALAFDPQSPDLKLELASRYIDAAQPEKAIAVLTPVVAQPQARAETVLRLGYAHQLKGNLDEAEKLFARAVDAARSPGEWRTRARAKLDLARVALARGNKARARELLLEAVATGAKPRPGSSEDAELWAIAKPEELVAQAPKGAWRTAESSPFQLGPHGDLEPGTSAKPPRGLDRLKP